MSSDGKTDEAKGRVKEAAGSLTGDDDLKDEGKVDRGEGEAKQKVDDAKDTVEDAADSVADKAKDVINRD